MIERIDSGPRMSKAVAHDRAVYLSGQVADDTSQDVRGQARNILAKIDALLARADTDKSQLLSVTIWLADIADYDAMNEVWDAWVAPGDAPARATVEARLAAPEYRIEIAAIAAR